MIPIILVTHGPVGKALIEASEMIVGRSEGLYAICLGQNDDVAELNQKLEAVIVSAKDGDGALVLVDLKGGSPYNAVSSCLGKFKDVECITGLNLCMLLTALESRDENNLETTIEECIAAGKAGILDARKHLASLTIDND